MTKKVKRPDVNQGARIKVDPSKVGGSTLTELVRFSFQFFRTECIDSCDKNDLDAAHRRLRTMSTMTWQQVNQAPREGLGSERIGRDQLLVPCELAPGVTHVLSFRCSAAERIIGHRDGSVLQILWFSHNHDAYRA